MGSALNIGLERALGKRVGPNTGLDQGLVSLRIWAAGRPMIRARFQGAIYHLLSRRMSSKTAQNKISDHPLPEAPLGRVLLPAHPKADLLNQVGAEAVAEALEDFAAAIAHDFIEPDVTIDVYEESPFRDADRFRMLRDGGIH